MEMNTKLQIIERETLDSVRASAFDEASSSHKNPIQVLLFTQGDRVFASGTLQIGRALQMMKTDPVELKKNEKASLDQVRSAYNRPINKDHVKSVSDYLCKNIGGKYILPSLTVNTVVPHKIFALPQEGVRMGYLLVDFMSPDLTVTDGQHRLNGIRDAIAFLEANERFEDAERLKSDGISIMFSFEDEKDQVHQDFADCSKTKALPKSMIAVYDKRVPVNRLTMDVIDKCPIYNQGKVDTASTSLSAKSSAFALASNVRGLLKSIYTGQPSLADAAFDKMTNTDLADDSVYNEFSNTALHYLNLLIENNSTLNVISQLPKGPERQAIPKLRQEMYIANPAGMNLCGIFIRHLLDNHSLSNEEREEFVIALARDIPWEKSSEMWVGNIITQGTDKSGLPKYSINSNNRAVKEALYKIKKCLGYTEYDLLNLVQ
ncbi:hypothetical protein CWO33_01335 [Vibrio splendidus]|uniref:DNA sulfur modification protein DndB n=1 Tax=Vibrio splendidus TaxID=29497 RepID=UPI000D334762|nr:DNA sulfur modification protein DndB [Vibrio splendidus]PTQ18199.1 hypothetical protein CWO33_01335 [Vibrio splendidus]